MFKQAPLIDLFELFLGIISNINLLILFGFVLISLVHVRQLLLSMVKRIYWNVKSL